MREPLVTRITRHFLPVEATVLGVRLGEFTLWHWRKLAEFESPYANLKYGEGFGQLATAVRICAAPVFSPISFQVPWRERLRWRWRAMRFGGMRMIAEEQVFFEWLIYQLTPPAKWHKGEGKGIRCPAWLYAVSCLMEMGIHPQTAWAMRVGEARCYLAASGINRGGGDFLDDEEVADLIDKGMCTLEDLGLD